MLWLLGGLATGIAYAIGRILGESETGQEQNGEPDDGADSQILPLRTARRPARRRLLDFIVQTIEAIVSAAHEIIRGAWPAVREVLTNLVVTRVGDLAGPVPPKQLPS